MTPYTSAINAIGPRKMVEKRRSRKAPPPGSFKTPDSGQTKISATRFQDSDVLSAVRVEKPATRSTSRAISE
ncbi:MAG: hypothetical protein DMF56_13160 [Acidobacteria bacterium]|nr:MAG: hypothetical protein DMF56_13160 [Acidobacteriota bacterium]